MSAGLEGIDHAVQQARIWINTLDDRLGWDNKPRAWRLLKACASRASFHLQVNEAADLGARLPTLIRGIYYDQWRPAKTPAKDRHLEELPRRDPAGPSRPRPAPTTPRPAASAVMAMLSRPGSPPARSSDVRRALPAGIRALWPRRPPRREASAAPRRLARTPSSSLGDADRGAVEVVELAGAKRPEERREPGARRGTAPPG